MYVYVYIYIYTYTYIHIHIYVHTSVAILAQAILAQVNILFERTPASKILATFACGACPPSIGLAVARCASRVACLVAALLADTRCVLACGGCTPLGSGAHKHCAKRARYGMPPKARAPPPPSLTLQDDLLLQLLVRQRGKVSPLARASTADPKQSAWLCKYKDCPTACKGKANFAHRITCFGCERPKTAP